MMKKLLAFSLCTMAPCAAMASLSVPSALTQERKAIAGDHYQGAIPIVNMGDDPLVAKVSLVDYHYNSQGESSFGELGTNQRSNAPWITVSHPFIEVPPHHTAQVFYEVVIPEEDTLIGTYWSMVLIEPAENGANLAEDNEIGLQTIVRYGVQLITQIGDTGKHDLKILNQKMEEEEGRIIGFLEVENTGSRLLDPQLMIDLFDDEGNHVGHFLGGKLRILPTCSVKYDIDLSFLQTGQYRAAVILDSGERGVFNAEYQINI